MPSAPAIRIDVTASRAQRVVSAGVLMAATVALALAPWSLPLRGFAVLVLGAAVVVGRIRGRGHPDMAAIEWRADGSWWLQWDRSDTFEPVGLVNSRVLAPVIALAFDAGDGGRSRQVILWPDSAHPDALRRLRVRLARHGVDGHVPHDGALH